MIEELLRAAGGALLFHDIQDVPKIDRIHHWQIGAALIVASYHKEIGELLFNGKEKMG